MAKQTINIGSAANDGTGDSLRDAGGKINDNFTELYDAIANFVELQGDIDCSANPNYPAAEKGDLYYASVAGKIGGASGKSVDVGDAIIAKADNAGGTEASVGSSWFVLEHNLTGVISGSLASTTEQLTGTDSSKLSTPDSVAALWEQGSDVASAATISLGEGGFFHVTGTTTITDIDFGTDKAGRAAWVMFSGALTLTHNSSTLILPTGANITTAAGDTACFVSEGSDVIRCLAYVRADGSVISHAADTDVWAGTDTKKPLTAKSVFDSAAVQTLTVNGSGPYTLDPDFGAGLNFKATLTQNVTLSNPSNAKDGQSGVIRLTQDATGGRTIAYGSNWRFPGGAATGGVLSTAAGAVDQIAYIVGSSGLIYATLSKAFAA